MKLQGILDGKTFAVQSVWTFVNWEAIKISEIPLMSHHKKWKNKKEVNHNNKSNV